MNSTPVHSPINRTGNPTLSGGGAQAAMALARGGSNAGGSPVTQPNVQFHILQPPAAVTTSVGSTTESALGVQGMHPMGMIDILQNETAVEPIPAADILHYVSTLHEQAVAVETYLAPTEETDTESVPESEGTGALPSILGGGFVEEPAKVEKSSGKSKKRAAFHSSLEATIYLLRHGTPHQQVAYAMRLGIIFNEHLHDGARLESQFAESSLNVSGKSDDMGSQDQNRQNEMLFETNALLNYVTAPSTIDQASVTLRRAIAIGLNAAAPCFTGLEATHPDGLGTQWLLWTRTLAVVEYLGASRDGKSLEPWMMLAKELAIHLPVTLLERDIVKRLESEETSACQRVCLIRCVLSIVGDGTELLTQSPRFIKTLIDQLHYLGNVEELGLAGDRLPGASKVPQASAALAGPIFQASGCSQFSKLRVNVPEKGKPKNTIPSANEATLNSKLSNMDDSADDRDLLLPQSGGSTQGGMGAFVHTPTEPSMHSVDTAEAEHLAFCPREEVAKCLQELAQWVGLPMVTAFVLPYLAELQIDDMPSVSLAAFDFLLLAAEYAADELLQKHVIIPSLMGYITNKPPSDIARGVAQSVGQLFVLLGDDPEHQSVFLAYYTDLCQSRDKDLRKGAAAAAQFAADVFGSSATLQLCKSLVSDTEPEVRIALAANFHALIVPENLAKEAFIALLSDPVAAVKKALLDSMERLHVSLPALVEHCRKEPDPLSPGSGTGNSTGNTINNAQFVPTVLQLISNYYGECGGRNWRELVYCCTCIDMLVDVFRADEIWMSFGAMLFKNLVQGPTCTKSIVAASLAMLTACLAGGAHKEGASNDLATQTEHLQRAAPQLRAALVGILTLAQTNSTPYKLGFVYLCVAFSPYCNKEAFSVFFGSSIEHLCNDKTLNVREAVHTALPCLEEHLSKEISGRVKIRLKTSTVPPPASAGLAGLDAVMLESIKESTRGTSGQSRSSKEPAENRVRGVQPMPLAWGGRRDSAQSARSFGRRPSSQSLRGLGNVDTLSVQSGQSATRNAFQNPWCDSPRATPVPGPPPELQQLQDVAVPTTVMSLHNFGRRKRDLNSAGLNEALIAFIQSQYQQQLTQAQSTSSQPEQRPKKNKISKNR